MISLSYIKMVEKEIFDVAIIGAGVVGLAGAIYARRMNLKTIVFGTTITSTSVSYAVSRVIL